MAEEPDQLRQSIESTRASLTRDVDMLAEKASPTRVAQRRWSAVKEKVMGSSEYTKHVAADGTSSARSTVQDKAGAVQEKAGAVQGKAGEAAHEVADSVRNAPQAVARQAQGNPLAAGIIAFGVGMLAASVIPVSDLERRAGQQVKDNAGDLTNRVKDVAGEVKSDLSGSVQQAVGQVKETASDAAQTTKNQAQSSAQGATDRTKQAAQNAS